MKYVTCQAGHDSHETKTVQAQGLQYQVYDWESYFQTVDGNEVIPRWPDKVCQGQDIISYSLDRAKVWEKRETELVKELLSDGDRNSYVLDFGSQIGYYSILAASMGYPVVSYDSSPENLELLKKSAELNGLSDKIRPVRCWIDEEWSHGTFNWGEAGKVKKIRLVKVDIEGAEQYAIKYLSKQFEDKVIEYALIEVSPVFNDSYPDLVEWIVEKGYRCYQVNDDGLYEIPSEGRREYVAGLRQENFLFSRKYD